MLSILSVYEKYVCPADYIHRMAVNSGEGNVIMKYQRRRTSVCRSSGIRTSIVEIACGHTDIKADSLWVVGPRRFVQLSLFS